MSQSTGDPAPSDSRQFENVAVNYNLEMSFERPIDSCSQKENLVKNMYMQGLNINSSLACTHTESNALNFSCGSRFFPESTYMLTL